METKWQGLSANNELVLQVNNNRTAKNHPKDPNTVKTISFLLNVWKTWRGEKNIVNMQNREK